MGPPFLDDINKNKLIYMKKLFLSIIFTFMTLASFACHYSYLTLNSGPTPIGGGLYSTDVTVCIGQKQNWGGTSNFTLCFDVPISSASGPNFPNVTNTYNICGGPCGPTQSVTATATGTISGNCITYNTVSSTPAGYPLVPDRYDGGAGAAGNSNSFCFTITIVTVGYPSTLALAGNVEADPGISGNDGTHLPCNGNPYDANMTITFGPLPVVFLEFNVTCSGFNWETASEINNDFFTIYHSYDAYNWNVHSTYDGSGNSNIRLLYEFSSEDNPNGYYKLEQTDFNGTTVELDMQYLQCNNYIMRTPRMYHNVVGQEVNVRTLGLIAVYYDDDSVELLNFLNQDEWTRFLNQYK